LVLSLIIDRRRGYGSKVDGMTLVLMTDGEDARLVRRVPQGEAPREQVLRDMIYDNPAIMPVHDLDPSFGRLFAVARELNIPGVGFVDVLLADERGRLVVVECKLWRNPQARREVVGQILDYARELSRYGYEDLQRQISIATKRTGNVLYALARDAGSTLEEAAFVDRVARDLTAGRFLLLIVGDGIAEGTRRIGEYLRDQPGLAFDFGLIEMAEYRYRDTQGLDHVIVQPRILAQTALIERHVIRSEIPNVTIDRVTPSDPATGRSTALMPPSDAGLAWRAFVERFIAETRFDDPGQPPPKNGGNGWIRIPLPGSLYINAYRSGGDDRVGVQVRFPGGEGAAVYAALKTEREAIDQEFARTGFAAPDWIDGDVPILRLTTASPMPWDAATEEVQRSWMGRASNQFVNSLRPRLLREGGL
jgi:hypothetical protein